MKLKLICTLSAVLSCVVGWSQSVSGSHDYDFTADDENGNAIYYYVTEWENDVYEVEVTYKEYSTGVNDYYKGAVVIPDEVYWEGGWGNKSDHYSDQFPAATYKVTSINGSAFLHCAELTEVTIGANVWTIGHERTTESPTNTTASFSNCTGLERVNFSSAGNLTYIGESTFLSCTSLTSIALPEGVTTIDNNAFDNCSALTFVSLPKTLTTINDCAFYGCKALHSVTLPEGVSHVGWMAFWNCSSLERVVLLGGTPPSIDESGGKNILSNDVDNVKIYVPATAYEAYAATLWGEQNYATLMTYDGMSTMTLVITDGEDGLAFSTLYDGGEDTLLPASLTAYTISEVDSEGGLTLVELSEGTIPAGTAALIAGEKGTYDDMITVAPSETSSSVEGNMLYGSDETRTTTVGEGNDEDYYFYKLTTNAAGDESTAAFYWGASGGAPFEMPGGKAWLAVPRSVFVDGVNGLKMKFPEGDGEAGDSTTEGITSIRNSVVHEEIYTIQGVRVNDMNRKGIYIVDGRKVVKR